MSLNRELIESAERLVSPATKDTLDCLLANYQEANYLLAKTELALEKFVQIESSKIPLLPECEQLEFDFGSWEEKAVDAQPGLA